MGIRNGRKTAVQRGHMAFNPFKERGIPIDQQFKDWAAINVVPFDKETVHPYTRARVILMNGIEVDGALFGHQFSMHSDELELKQLLAVTGRIEQQQQKIVNWLLPVDATPLEVTIAYEQVAVDLTAWQARTEPDPYVKATLNFALIEDFDHLYRYSNLLQLTQEMDAADIVGDLTEIFPGRPAVLEHRHPADTLRRHYDHERADPLTKLHVATITAAEQQTMNYYMNIGPTVASYLGRGLYQEIAQIEEQHVSRYESLADPRMTWCRRLLLHEYNECYMYYSCLESEVDDRIRVIWEEHLRQELEHLRIAGDTLKQRERTDPESVLPSEFPEVTIFQPNKEYIRHVIETEINLTARGTEFVRSDDLPFDAPYYIMQRALNEGESIPSQDVVEETIRLHGQDYRLETEGLHPVEWLQIREQVPL